MAIFSIDKVSITGLAVAVPKNTELNIEYPYHTDLERQQFLKTTGIEERRIVNDSTTAADLCYRSAKDLLEELEWDKESIKVLIFISQTPDYLIPGTAPFLQEKLGLSKSTLTFDINLGCSGYVYGLSVIASLLEKTKGKALLLVGDVSSSIINKKDKTVAPLFSDAGSCTALEYDDNASQMVFNLQSDGKGYEAIKRQDGGMKSPFSEQSLIFNDETNRRGLDMKLNGIDVFNFSRKEVVPNIENLTIAYNIDIETIDYFVFHQANLFMNEHIRKKLKIEASKVPYSLRKLGNTSSASIPITLINNLGVKLQEKPLKLLLSGFGVGLSWGSSYIQTNKIKTLPLIEV
jgi:3-oxoacyl-[acyl-carrier-protein] synthase-3